VKRLLAVLGLVTALAISQPALASGCCGDEYDESQSHPLRLAAYAVHPAGYLVKWLVVWPIHCLVSQPGLDEVFGHRPHQDYTFDDEYL
jgi:hypothetical protein